MDNLRGSLRFREFRFSDYLMQGRTVITVARPDAKQRLIAMFCVLTTWLLSKGGVKLKV